MLDALKKQVCEANKLLREMSLVVLTWGNVSGICRESGHIVIKPSGIEYADLTPENMSVVALDGTHISGPRPSSDTPTHLELYRAWHTIGGIAHTHSKWATIYAQQGREIIPMGTTHADFAATEIPVTRALTDSEIAADYEGGTGRIIIEAIADPTLTPAALVCHHGPFTWGSSPQFAATNSLILEQIAHMAYFSNAPAIPQALHHKHFYRKHGEGAYYGQG